MKVLDLNLKFSLSSKGHKVWSASSFLFPAFGFLLCLISCSSNPDSPGTSSPKFKQYYVQGEKLYAKYCSNCHQPDGTGLGRVYPPLNNSDFMEHSFDESICLIRYGIAGQLTVNGVQFNQEMKGIPALSDLEIAEITTYIYNTWGHQKGITEVRDVSRILNNCRVKP